MKHKRKWSRRFIWSIVFSIIFYQILFTWIPLWKNAGNLQGYNAAALSFINEKGQPIRIQDFQGQPLILSFWASWCLPCRAEIPFLNGIYEELTDQKKQLIGINVRESWTTIRNFQQKTSMNFPTYQDIGSLSSTLGITMLPALVVLDENSRVVSITYGFRPWLQAYLLWWI